jgi:GNAT superfamily N-acetyltransferase
MSTFNGTIRPLAPDDRAAWAPLWAGYLAFYRTDLAPEITETAFARLSGGDPAMFAYVAMLDDAMVGIVHCVMHPATWSIGPYCYLEDLFVSPDVRGGGIGRALIEAVYAEADRRKAARVYWLTHESNATARKLYDTLATHAGFIQYRR